MWSPCLFSCVCLVGLLVAESSWKSINSITWGFNKERNHWKKVVLLSAVTPTFIWSKFPHLTLSTSSWNVDLCLLFCIWRYEGWVAGYQAAYDTANSKLIANNFSFGYRSSDFNIHSSVWVWNIVMTKFQPLEWALLHWFNFVLQYCMLLTASQWQ